MTRMPNVILLGITNLWMSAYLPHLCVLFPLVCGVVAFFPTFWRTSTPASLYLCALQPAFRAA